MKHALKMIALALPFAFGMASGPGFADQAGKKSIGNMFLEAPYVRAMLPGAKVGGGYMTIANHGAEDRLLGARCGCAGGVEIHEMKMDGGVMSMKALKEGIAIPANATVELKPGGYHLMFLDVPRPFKEGEVVKATLTFEKAGSVEVDLPVGPAAGGAPKMGHSAGEHGGHEGHGQ